MNQEMGSGFDVDRPVRLERLTGIPADLARTNLRVRDGQLGDGQVLCVTLAIPNGLSARQKVIAFAAVSSNHDSYKLRGLVAYNPPT